MLENAIVASLLVWWDKNRVALPWRGAADPYAVWVSEVMLQQTQIATVIPYYERWMAALPSVTALAAAPLTQVLKLWEGLGYYSRARNLRVAAQMVVDKYNGRIPTTAKELQKLPGVGRYTAGAIASIAFNEPTPVLDGNVIRVLARLFDLAEDVTKTAVKNHLWGLAADQVPPKRPGDYNQALMELGQTICLPAAPRCHECPIADPCLARQRGTQLERPVKPPRAAIPHYDVAAGVIWREDSRLLIAQRPLDGLLGGLWEFPGGKLENGETAPQALRREIREELVMEIAVERPLQPIKHAYTHFRITLHPFHARWLSGEPQHIGVADHAWVALADLERYPFAVTDQKIIAQLRTAEI
jgi:A/G-specific adenine glycosylase